MSRNNPQGPSPEFLDLVERRLRAIEDAAVAEKATPSRYERELGHLHRLMQLRGYVMLHRLDLPDLTALMVRQIREGEAGSPTSTRPLRVTAVQLLDGGERKVMGLATGVPGILMTERRPGYWLTHEASGLLISVATRTNATGDVFGLLELAERLGPLLDWTVPVLNTGSKEFATVRELVVEADLDELVETAVDASAASAFATGVLCTDCGEMHECREDCPNHVAF